MGLRTYVLRPPDPKPTKPKSLDDIVAICFPMSYQVALMLSTKPKLYTLNKLDASCFESGNIAEKLENGVPAKWG